ncbi:hypothetical protein BV898_19730 [Hypsibius exemplaris]|uniref:Uncharacterized protein n=1 Tax=Hypsibius exemplaris TaxID=2072580 RepID=A0A9X6NRH2_HYPEX|nr:hypothetical protein BV898_19730 [Hypsibius exemplaris]
MWTARTGPVWLAVPIPILSAPKLTCLFGRKARWLPDGGPSPGAVWPDQISLIRTRRRLVDAARRDNLSFLRKRPMLCRSDCCNISSLARPRSALHRLGHKDNNLKMIHFAASLATAYPQHLARLRQRSLPRSSASLLIGRHWSITRPNAARPPAPSSSVLSLLLPIRLGGFRTLQRRSRKLSTPPFREPLTAPDHPNPAALCQFMDKNSSRPESWHPDDRPRDAGPRRVAFVTVEPGC